MKDLYVKIKDNKRELKAHPKWRFDDGSLVDDVWLQENENMYPVYEPDNLNENKEYYLKSVNDWEFNGEFFIKSYYEVIDNKPEIDEFYQSLLLLPESRWEINKNEDSITKEYKLLEKSLETLKKDLINQLKSIRYSYEVGGILFKGLKIHTDRESQTKILTTFVKLNSDNNIESVNWKTMDGFIEISREDFIVLSFISGDFVQECYDIERDIKDLIDNSNTIEELKNNWNNNISSNNWPSIALYNKGV